MKGAIYVQHWHLFIRFNNFHRLDSNSTTQASWSTPLHRPEFEDDPLYDDLTGTEEENASLWSGSVNEILDRLSDIQVSSSGCYYIGVGVAHSKQDIA